MALRSDDNHMTVDTEKGIYVEMAGIMEVRTLSPNGQFEDEWSQDMYDFQNENRSIDSTYCHKDPDGYQNIFFCLVCNCDLKSIVPLIGHVQGAKHIRKALEKKRDVLGMPSAIVNQPKKKEQKAPKKRQDVNMRLEERLRECDEPILGLSNVKEFLNPRQKKDPLFYSCTQEGCKSAWGYSDDMFNHLKNRKHQKNFLRLAYPEDDRIESLNKNDVLLKAVEHANDHNIFLPDDRDYGSIVQILDSDAYKEISSRPQNWSESKEKMGMNGNTNHTPLGSRKRAAEVVDPLSAEDEAWKHVRIDPEPLNTLLNLAKQLIQDMKSKVDGIEALEADEINKCVSDIQFCVGCLELHTEVKEVNDTIGQLNNVKNSMLDLNEREVKYINKILSELEQEIENYVSDRDKNPYKNYKERIRVLTQDLAKFTPKEENQEARKHEFNNRIAKLWVNFEERSDTLVAPSPQKTIEDRKKFTALFSAELTKVVAAEVEKKIGNKSALEKDAIVQKLVTKILPNETTVFEKKGMEWSFFECTEKIKDRAQKYSSSYITKKFM